MYRRSYCEFVISVVAIGSVLVAMGSDLRACDHCRRQHRPCCSVVGQEGSRAITADQSMSGVERALTNVHAATGAERGRGLSNSNMQQVDDILTALEAKHGIAVERQRALGVVASAELVNMSAQTALEVLAALKANSGGTDSEKAQALITAILPQLKQLADAKAAAAPAAQGPAAKAGSEAPDSEVKLTLAIKALSDAVEVAKQDRAKLQTLRQAQNAAFDKLILSLNELKK